MLKNRTLYCASLGDSRAVVGTLQRPATPYVIESDETDDHRDLIQIRMSRKIPSKPGLQVFQLTQDQKPHDKEEAARIVQAGGRIDRFKDEQGNGLGPYRVFKEGKQVPALAMSRSLGDSMASQLGVCSDPIITVHEITNSDLFIAMGSDGVWDPMTNQEVADFVEAYRRNCVNGPGTQEAIISPHCVNIAQLLAEEARLRWRGICEAQDVPIDDISTIVVELNIEA